MNIIVFFFEKKKEKKPLLKINFIAQNDQSLRFRIFKKILFVLPEGNFSTLRLLLKFLSEYIEHNPNKKTYLSFF